jgi:hypothetical protein
MMIAKLFIFYSDNHIGGIGATSISEGFTHLKNL